MKRHLPTTHTAIISHTSAGCACRQWPGLTRQEGEAIGPFTLRADQAHRSHVTAVQEAPADLFSAAPSTVPAFGLFADQESAQ